MDTHDMDTHADRRKHARINEQRKIMFFLDSDIMNTYTVDVSESGLRLVMEHPIYIHIQFLDDDRDDYTAQLVWSKQTADGKIECGFKYVDQ